MTYEEMKGLNPLAAEEWARHWTKWLESEGEEPSDRDRPWEDVFGDDGIDFTCEKGGKVEAYRDAVPGFAEMNWLWDGSSWNDILR